MRATSWKLIRWLKGYFGETVKPKSTDKDVARQEYILNVLLLGSLILSFLGGVVTWRHLLLASPSVRTSYWPVSLLISSIFLFFLICYLTSREGRSRLVSYIIIFSYLLGATYTAYSWGIYIPQSLLTYSLIVVLSGILVGSQFAFFITLLIFLILVLLVCLQNSGLIAVDISWTRTPPTIRDALIFGATYSVIALVTWLFDRDLEHALARARFTEAELKKQRDLLELTVEERTRELKQAQAEKIGQLYRLAEFGRSASGIFHDLANPLTVVSLNLNLLNAQKEIIKPEELTRAQVLLERALVATKRLENFVQTARRQLQNQEELLNFSLPEEIKQATQFLEHKAVEAGARIFFTYPEEIKMFGSPVKFNQIITNLVSNAIDSYEGTQKKVRKVKIRLLKTDHHIIVEVKDHGKGISRQNLRRIFEPFSLPRVLKRAPASGSLSPGILSGKISAAISGLRAGWGSALLSLSTFLLLHPN